jgi:RES domain-containing protein
VLLWRISNYVTLDGGGGLVAPGRWHNQGRRIVYCAPNPATAILEMLVRTELRRETLPLFYTLVKVEAPDDVRAERLELAGLPDDWPRRLPETRIIGDAWLDAGATALLHVPCAIAPESWNTLINPTHPEASRVSVLQAQRYRLDERL